MTDIPSTESLSPIHTVEPPPGFAIKNEQLVKERLDEKIRVTKEYSFVGGQVLDRARSNLIENPLTQVDYQEYAGLAGKKGAKLSLTDGEQSKFAELHYKMVLGGINRVQNATGNLVSAQTPHGITFGGEALQVATKGNEQVDILSITEFDDDIATCHTLDGSIIQVPRQNIIAQLMVSEKNNLVGQTPASQREALETYIDMCDANAKGETYAIENADKEGLKMAARSLGIVTTESMHTMIAGLKLPKERQEQLEKYLLGSTIVEPQILGEMLASLDATSQLIKEQEILLNDPRLSAEQRKLIEEKIAFLDSKCPKSAQNFSEFFEKIYTGKLTIPNPHGIDAAIAGGDIDAIFDDLLAGLPTDKKNLIKEKFTELAKFGGMTAIIVLAGVILQGLAGK